MGVAGMRSEVSKFASEDGMFDEANEVKNRGARNSQRAVNAR